MKHTRLIAGICSAGFVGVCCLLYGYAQGSSGEILDFASWAPGPAAIRSKIGSEKAPNSGMTAKVRREQFCEMFKARFRHHDPAVAVGLRFITPTRIKLMCPARMEPFFVDRIAMAAWREARDDFGKSVDLDLYHTFIGTNQVKIGELRVSSAAPDMAHITYDYKMLLIVNRPRTGRPGDGIPIHGLRLKDLPPNFLNPPGRPAL